MFPSHVFHLFCFVGTEIIFLLGLNVVSEFNLENVTEYGTEASEHVKEMITEEENDQDENIEGDMK